VSIAVTKKGAPAARLRTSPLIRHALIDDLVIIMNLNEDNYEVLDERATLIWCALLQANGSVAGAQQVVRENCADLADDAVADFLLLCQTRGLLIVDGEMDPQPAILRRPVDHMRYPSLLAWQSMLSIARNLRRRGFPATYNELVRTHWGPHAKSSSIACDRAVEAFVRAENLFWFRRAPRDCLPRSLALYLFLSRLGIPVTHRIGGRRFPGFVMHAWVEHKDIPLIEDDKQIAQYAVIASLPHG
jgi:hypothetical protein